MQGKLIFEFSIVLILFNIGASAFGFETEDIQMHGFVSQGYLKSSDNNYLCNCAYLAVV